MAIHRVVSIEIGLAKTRVCETDFKKKNPKIHKCVVFDTPENTIEDAYVRDKALFANALKTELERAGIKCKNFMFTANSSKIISREIAIPKVPENLIGGVIESKKDEYFPMDISEHELAYTIIEEDKTNNQLKMIVYAVPQTLVKNYQNLVEELDGKLVALDYAGNSLYQWTKRILPKEQEISMVLQMNVQNSLVMILENGVLALQRNIGFGTNNVVEALREACKNDAVPDVSEAYGRLETEKLVKERFIEGDSEQSDNMKDSEWLKLVELQEAVTESLRPFVVNVNRVIEYYSTKNKTARIPEIHFLGLGTRINGLQTLIGNEIGLPVKPVTELTGISIPRDSHVLHSADLITCLGASVETIRFLNLKFTERKKDEGQGIGGIILIAALAVVAAGVLIATSQLNLAEARKENEALKQEYDDKKGILDVKNDFLAKTKVLSEVTLADANTFNYNEVFNDLLKELEKKLPTATIVHNLASSGDVFVMSVSVPDKTTAAKFLLKLQEIPYLSSASVTALTENVDDVTGVTQVTFTVTCTYGIDIGGALEELGEAWDELNEALKKLQGEGGVK